MVELFFANAKNQYLEVEVGPHGHWLCILHDLHDGFRKPFNTGENLQLEVQNTFIGERGAVLWKFRSPTSLQTNFSVSSFWRHWLCSLLLGISSTSLKSSKSFFIFFQLLLFICGNFLTMQ